MNLRSFSFSYKFSVLTSVVLGLIIYLISSFGKSDSITLKGQIEDNLIQELKQQNQYIDKVVSDFSTLETHENDEAEYPTFIFTTRELIRWNTSKIDLKFRKLARLSAFGLTHLHRSQFLYQKRTITRDDEKYILVSLIPLFVNYEIENQYLNSNLNDKIFPERVKIVDGSSIDPVHIEAPNDVTFYISLNDDSNFGKRTSILFNVLGFALSILVLLAIFQFASSWDKNGNPLIGFLILLFSIFLTRFILLSISFPFRLAELDLFNSSVYTSSTISPSLGDLLLNHLSVLTIALYVFNCRFTLAEKVANSYSRILRALLQIGLFIGSYWMLFWYGNTILDILSNSQISLDMSQSIEFDNIRVISFLIILISGLVTFLSIHIVYKVIFHGDSKGIMSFISKTWPILILGIYLGLSDTYFLIILAFHVFYFVIVYSNDLPSRMRSFKFGSLLYILLAIILLSSVGAYSIYRGFETNNLIQKQKFSTKLLIERDVEGEYLLNEISSTIKSDMILNSRLISPRVSIGQVKDRINQLFLDGYFNGYEIRTKIFDKDGVSIGKAVGIEYFHDLKNQVSREEFQTDFANIFFEGNFLSTGRKRYLCFIELERYNNRTGYIIIELVQKKQVSKSVYPELLINNPQLNDNKFDYAVYDQNGLLYSVGDFNYKADFAPVWTTDSQIKAEGIDKYGYHHWSILTGGRSFVITSKLYTFWKFLSNFSFLFLLFLFVAVIITVVNSVLNQHRLKSFTFSTKVLIYLGCAFAIPLLLVGAAILNTINISYKAEIDKSFQKQTVAMSENFVDLISGFYDNEINRDGLSNELLKVSKSSRADINLYDNEGKLIATSQPRLIESGLLSPFINPVALSKLRNEKNDKIILKQTIGKLTYKSSFVAVRAYDDGKLLGIMSSPFFSSKNHLSRQQTEVFDNIINISTIIFILSIGLSYVAVRRLTNPIILIASRLKKTELEEDNQPLEWNTDDEIGVLVKEYNSMLEKLDFSKKELARNEKEAAWREMAKQVAHEIKNPLTPMKLTLQHLDRVMDKEDESRKSLSTLLSQVDTLDQIVTSFSHFAKMPDPENEVFNIVSELEKALDLHPDKEILLNLSEKEVLINADKKLFGRIFNNLILNAFQAMVKVKSPTLQVNVKVSEGKVQMAFEDQGCGISDSIRDKVFIPNFSTKASGSGIGLAVAKRGIENAHGHIWFEPNTPSGTVFYIELPIVEA